MYSGHTARREERNKIEAQLNLKDSFNFFTQ